VTTLEYKYDLAEEVGKMYRETDRILEPLYPWVLVRPLPRSNTTKSGLIYMPEKQNKPNLESVVLATWKPFWEHVGKENTTTGEVLAVKVWNESDVKPGDHVIHPHHVGMPDAYLEEHSYRLVREEDICSTLKYHHKDWLAQQVADSIINAGMGMAMGKVPKIVEEIMQNFDIVPKHGYQPLTTSGK